MTLTPLFPNEAPFELSAYYPASRVRFVHIPAGVRQAGFHTLPSRLLAVWLDGQVEFETSDGERGETRQFRKGGPRRGYARKGTHLAPSIGRAEPYFGHAAKRSRPPIRLISFWHQTVMAVLPT